MILVVEVAFIVFLFFANLLMGEFTHSGIDRNKGLMRAVYDIFTVYNFIIAIVAALVGHLFFENMRRRL